MRQLLAEGARIDTANSLGWYPIHRAAQRGAISCLPIVLEAMAKQDGVSIDVDVTTNEGVTALMLAAARCLESTRLLLAAGADAACCSEAGWSAVHSAAASRSLDVLTMVLEAKGRPPPGAEHESLASAVEAGDEPYPLLTAALEKDADLDMLKKLLEAGASIKCREISGMTPLMMATQLQRADAVELFCQHGVTVEMVAMSLHLLVAHPSEARATILRMLLDQCGGVKYKDFSRLCRCLFLGSAEKSDEEFLELMMQHKAVRDTSFGWKLSDRELLAMHNMSLDFVEVLVRHSATLLCDASFLSLLDITAGGSCILNGTLLAVRLLQDSRCQQILAQTGPSATIRAVSPLRHSGGAVFRLPSAYCVRRQWKLICALHEVMPDDFWMHRGFGLPTNRMLKMIAIAFCLVRGFIDPKLHSLGMYGAGDGGASDESRRHRVMLQLSMQVTGQRLSVAEAQRLRLPADIVSQPAPLLVLARCAVHRHLRELHGHSASCGEGLKMSREVARVAALLPAGLRSQLTLEDTNTTDMLRQMFDVSKDSAWVESQHRTVAYHHWRRRASLRSFRDGIFAKIIGWETQDRDDFLW